MIFVIGPLFSGKQDYIMQALGWSETDFLEKAVRDVQNLAAEAVEVEEAAGAVEIAEAAETDGAAEAAEAPEAGGNSPSPLDDLQEKLRSLADRLSQKEVVIATETGCGLRRGAALSRWIPGSEETGRRQDDCPACWRNARKSSSGSAVEYRRC